jgi:hypothetical protein
MPFALVEAPKDPASDELMKERHSNSVVYPETSTKNINVDYGSNRRSRLRGDELGIE